MQSNHSLPNLDRLGNDLLWKVKFLLLKSKKTPA